LAVSDRENPAKRKKKKKVTNHFKKPVQRKGKVKEKRKAKR